MILIAYTLDRRHCIVAPAMNSGREDITDEDLLSQFQSLPSGNGVVDLAMAFETPASSNDTFDSIDSASDPCGIGVIEPRQSDNELSGLEQQCVAFSSSYLLDAETETAIARRYIRHHVVEAIIVEAALEEIVRLERLDNTAKAEVKQMRELGLATHFNSTSPDAFIGVPATVQRAENRRKYQRRNTGARKRLRAAKKAVCGDNENNGLPTIFEGTVCEGCFSGDGLWYPARVIAVLPRSRYRVRFYYYNNEENIPRSWIRPLSPSGRNQLATYLASSSGATSSDHDTASVGEQHIVKRPRCAAAILKTLHNIIYSPRLLLAVLPEQQSDEATANTEDDMIVLLQKLWSQLHEGHTLRGALLRSFRSVEGDTLAQTFETYGFPRVSQVVQKWIKSSQKCFDRSRKPSNSQTIKGKTEVSRASLSNLTHSKSDSTVEASETDIASVSKRKPRSRRGFLHRHSAVDTETPNPTPENVLDKYWAQRYRYFSKYDGGIELDPEGWFSVTPEQIATHIARRTWLNCTGSTPDHAASVRQFTILDAFCGCGGNAIAFARAGFQVTAIDLNEERLRMAKHNAMVYGVAHRIEFVCADSLAFCKGLPSRQKRPFDVVYVILPACLQFDTAFSFATTAQIFSPALGRS